MHLNPNAPLYYPSAPPPPPPPPFPQHIRTYIYYFPPRRPYPFFPFAASPLPGTPSSSPRKETLVWLPKESTKRNTKFLSATQVTPPPRVAVPTCFDFRSAGPELLMKGTTVMIKNIPNKITREMLIQMLDQHCAEQQKRLNDVYGEKKFVKSEYDFVYLPIDFRTQANKGYAFVNFTTAEAAKSAYEEMHHRKWVIFSSKKVAIVCFARVQGKTALVNRFKCTQFNCKTDDFLPAVFTPPRNGTSSLSPPLVIGTRITHFH